MPSRRVHYGILMYTDNYLFRKKTKIKIFIFPTIGKDRFLKGLKLVFAPILITNVFIKNDHRSGNNLFGKKIQNSFCRTVNIIINIQKTDWFRVVFNKTGERFLKPTIVKNDIFRNRRNFTLRTIGTFGFVMPRFRKSFKTIKSVDFLFR